MTDPQENPESAQNLSRLKAGCFLLATDALTDPNFKQTLILICQHSEEGSYGLVLNRVSHMPLGEIFNLENVPVPQSRKIRIGGPVQESQLQIINLTEMPVQEAVLVSEGVYLGGMWEELEKIVSSDDKEIMLFLGYSGWGGGQLENEINLGGWEVLEGPVGEILKAEEQLLGLGTEEFKKIYFPAL